MERQPINRDDSLREVLLKMAEENPSSLKVMLRILQRFRYQGFHLILQLDDMNIRGIQIWVGYKFHCRGNLDRFIQCIEERDPAMIETINREGSKGRYPHKASLDAKKREFLGNKGS